LVKEHSTVQACVREWLRFETELKGVNTAIYSPNGGSAGIGFSIPANLAKNVINQLEKSGVVERAWIGV